MAVRGRLRTLRSYRPAAPDEPHALIGVSHRDQMASIQQEIDLTRSRYHQVMPAMDPQHLGAGTKPAFPLKNSPAHGPNKQRISSGKHGEVFPRHHSCKPFHQPDRDDRGQRSNRGKHPADLFLAQRASHQEQLRYVPDLRNLAGHHSAQGRSDNTVPVPYPTDFSHLQRNFPDPPKSGASHPVVRQNAIQSQPAPRIHPTISTHSGKSVKCHTQFKREREY